MHSSISEGASTPTKENSFLELYQMTSYDLAKKKKTNCRKKEPLSRPQEKGNFASKWIKEEFPFSLTLLAAKSPIRFLSMTKEDSPMDSLVKIVTIPQT
ncbi:hypothetical protein TNCV_4739361 [Trichonephila clavipes]|nr:hypothetical protein TNCV_4739361 [Trichonephila clavipes]